MHNFGKKAEHFFDRMITPALLLLVLIVVTDIFFTEIKYAYENYFLLMDLTVIFIFLGDLTFKFERARNWKGFLKHEWIEILAIIPFFWIFRLLESVVRVGELVQEIIHLITRGGRLTRLFAVFSFTGLRSEQFKEFLKKVTRSERFERAADFFKHPNEDK